MVFPHTRFVAVHTYPFYVPVTENNVTRVVGYLSHLVNTMTSIFPSYEIIDSGETGAGVEVSPGNWTGPMGMFARGEADVYAGQWAALERVFLSAGFTTAHDIGSFSVLSGPPNKMTQKSFSLFSSFSYELWGYLAFSWLMVSLVYHAFAPIEDRLVYNKTRTQGLVSCLLTFYGLLFQKGFDHLPTTFSLRLMATGWLMLAVVMMTAFGGSLSSRLSVMDIPERIDSIEDVLKYPSIIPYITKQTVADAHVKESEMALYQALWRQVERHDGHQEIGFFFFTNALDEIIQGEAVLISNKECVLPMIVGFDCAKDHRPYYIAKEQFLPISVVVLYRKGLDPDIVEAINRRTLVFAAMGFASLLERTSRQQAEPCLVVSHSRSVTKPLNFRDLKQVFEILVVGLLGSVMVIFVEVFGVLGTKGRRNRTENNPVI